MPTGPYQEGRRVLYTADVFFVFVFRGWWSSQCSSSSVEPIMSPRSSLRAICGHLSSNQREASDLPNERVDLFVIGHLTLVKDILFVGRL